MDPGDSADDVPSDSLSMSSETPEQDETPGPRAQDPQAGSYFGQAYEWASAHPIQAASFGTLGAIAVVPAIVAGPALAAAGFGANGIMAGSAAAGIQSGIGNVVAPSLFATLQSAGAAGYGVSTVHSAVSAAALGTGTIGAAFSRWMGRRSNEGGDGEGEAGEGSAEADADGGGDGGPGDGPGGRAEKAQPETQDDGPQGYADKAETKVEGGSVPQHTLKAHL